MIGLSRLVSRRSLGVLAISLFFGFPLCQHALAAEATNTLQRGWISRPLGIADAVNLALVQNRTILKAKSDLEAAYGLVIQTRAIAIPKLQASGDYARTDADAVEAFPGQPQVYQNWDASLKIVQSVYEGGRILSSIRTAKLTKEQALLQYESVVADTLLAIRTNYYGVLLSAQEILVREASVNLLAKELDDQKRRYDAGTVPRFNVLRAEVAVANARPNLIRARNANRISKINLANQLGYDLPREIWDNIPLELTDSLDVAPFSIELSGAISSALERRTELGALRKAELLRREDIVAARSGMRPSLQAFAGWNWRNSNFSTSLADEVDGWQVGAQLNWNIFDGFATRGKVIQAKAAHEKAQIELDDTASRIELEVRTAYSEFVQAREVLESQLKVLEEAEESLRLANARADAGTGTQLDVLNAETALTEARTTQIEARHDYAVSIARLERAVGTPTSTTKK